MAYWIKIKKHTVSKDFERIEAVTFLITFTLRWESDEYFLILLWFILTVYCLESSNPKNASDNWFGISNIAQKTTIPWYSFKYFPLFHQFFPFCDHCSGFSRVGGRPSPASLPTRCMWARLHAAVLYVCTHEASHTPSGLENDSVSP